MCSERAAACEKLLRSPCDTSSNPHSSFATMAHRICECFKYHGVLKWGCSRRTGEGRCRGLENLHDKTVLFPHMLWLSSYQTIILLKSTLFSLHPPESVIIMGRYTRSCSLKKKCSALTSALRSQFKFLTFMQSSTSFGCVRSITGTA